MLRILHLEALKCLIENTKILTIQIKTVQKVLKEYSTKDKYKEMLNSLYNDWEKNKI